MNSIRLTLLLAVFALVLAGCKDAPEAPAVVAPAASSGDQDGENTGESKAAPDETAVAVETLRMADELAAVAIERGDAAMLVQAARIKSTIATQAGEGAEEGAAEGGDKDSGIDFSVEGLLDQAEVLAGGDTALLAAIGEARTEAARTRGRSMGPARWVRVVDANSRFFIRNVQFDGGMAARVALVGDGDTDLDLYIYDQNGNTICRSLGAWDRESCAWTPRWTGPFTVEVRNLGSVWNQFQLVTN